MENSDFRARFIEVCGTTKPGVVAQMFGISYQAARNYLKGRLPDAAVLILISEKTTYSLHWLLTGEGDKFIKIPRNRRKTILTDEMRAFIRHECLEIINEMLGGYEEPAPQNVVVLTSDSIKEEKVTDTESVARSAQ